MRRITRKNSDTGSMWITFSDLMSAMMLIFVLIMFFAVYQYYEVLETKTRELDEQKAELDTMQVELLRSQSLLSDKETALSEAQTTLTSQQEELDAKAAQLTAAEEEQLRQEAQLILLQSQLDAQSTALDSAQELLASQQAELLAAQGELMTAQEGLDAARAQLAHQQTVLEELVGVKTEIVQELVRALAASDISGATVDESGAIVFESEMLFDVSRSNLKNVGKDFLDSFIPSYLKVLMSDEYSGYVSQIIIEGHTDDDGEYLDNMALSQNRARAVLTYILSDEFTGISAAAKRRLQQIVTINGRSSSELIYNDDGTVNKAASRRVVIKFRMNDEDMVNNMLTILENME